MKKESESPLVDGSGKYEYDEATFQIFNLMGGAIFKIPLNPSCLVLWLYYEFLLQCFTEDVSS
jgi:hypothetical protein